MRILTVHNILTLILTLLLIVGCKPTVPSDYIQPDDMEDILYDYHLAVSIAQNENVSDVQRKAWQLAVLKKYDVDEKEFNRSMFYYMRHTERLQSIYENLADRLGEEALALGASDAELGQYGTISSRGDTTDVWPGRKTLILSTFAPYNKYTFEVKVDTAFHKGDRLVLSYDAQFILQEGMRDLTVGLVVTFSNDSTTQQIQQVASDMRQSMTIEDRDSLGIKSVRGFFLLGRNAPPPTTTLTLFFAENIKLIRIHPQKGMALEGSSNPMNPNTPIRNVGGSPAQRAPIQENKSSQPNAMQHTKGQQTSPPPPVTNMRSIGAASHPLTSVEKP